MIPVVLIWPNPASREPFKRHAILPTLPDTGHKFIPPGGEKPLHVLAIEWDLSAGKTPRIYVVLN